MATAVDTYVNSSSTSIYLGRYNVPDWVPSQGNIANINLNELSDVYPAAGAWWNPVGAHAVFRNWSGAVVTDDAVYFFGQGHYQGDDQNVVKFSLVTREWSWIGPGNPAADFYDGPPVEWNFDWNDLYDAGLDTYLLQGRHTYGYIVWVPPGTWGCGSQGALFNPTSLLNEGIYDSLLDAVHMFDIETEKWVRVANSATSVGALYNGSIYNEATGIIYWGGSGTSYCSIDTNDATPAIVRHSNIFAEIWPTTYYGRPICVEGQMLIFGRDSGSGNVKLTKFEVTTPGDAPTISEITLPAQAVAGDGFGIDWCPLTEKFYLYENVSDTDTDVQVLTPSTLNFSTCSWSWDTETFTGAPAYYSGGRSGDGFIVTTKWRWASSVRCFVWSDGPNYSAQCVDGITRNSVMQLWRPLGT